MHNIHMYTYVTYVHTYMYYARICLTPLCWGQSAYARACAFAGGIRVLKHVPARVCFCALVCTRACVRVRVHVCVHVCFYVCVRVHAYVRVSLPVVCYAEIEPLADYSLSGGLGPLGEG